MEQQNALKTLINAVTIATKRGAFELPEAKIIADAVEVFTGKPGATPKQEKAGPKPTAPKADENKPAAPGKNTVRKGKR